MSLSLFTIESELSLLLDGINEESSEVTINALTSALATKTDQVVHFRESLVNYTELLKEKIRELTDRKKEIENKVDAFDKYVINCMAIQCRDEFKGHLCKIKKRKPSQAVDIYDERSIPPEFIKAKPTIMVAEISKLLKQGEIIEGARLIDGKASLSYGLI